MALILGEEMKYKIFELEFDYYANLYRVLILNHIKLPRQG